MTDVSALFGPGQGFELADVLDLALQELSDAEISPSASPDTSTKKANVWLRAIQRGEDPPSHVTNEDMIGILQGFLCLKKHAAVTSIPMTPAAAARPGFRLVQIECPCGEFPQMLDLGLPGQKPISASQHSSPRAWLAQVAANPNATWVQTKTKFTRIVVELQDADGNPVKGTDVQPGGLNLQLTLHKTVGTEEESLLCDQHNRREGRLFSGTAGAHYDAKVKMLAHRHEFKFKVLCLSNDLQRSAVRLYVTPTHPDYARREALVVRTKPFMTRAADKAYLDRPKAETVGAKRARAEGKAPSPPNRLQLPPSLTVDADEYRRCEGVLTLEDDEPNYRGAFDDDDGDDGDGDGDDGDDVVEQEEEIDFGAEEAVPEDARITNPAGRAALRRLLSEAEGGKLPSGKELADALLACRISS